MSDWVEINPNFYSNSNKNFGLRYNKKTGDFQIRQKDSAGNYDGTSLETIYQNGSYTSPALKYDDLFKYADTDTDKKTPIIQAKAEELNTTARKKVNEVAKVDNRWNRNGAASNERLNDKAGVTNITSQTQSGISTSTSGILGGIGPLAEFPSIKNPAVGKVLKYPRDLISDQQDTLQITQIEYQAPYKDVFLPGGATIESILQSGLKRNTVIKNTLEGRVILPMPNVAMDSNSVNWGSDSMDAMTSAATALVTQGLTGATAINIITKLAGLVGVKGATELTKNAFLLNLLTKAATGGPESEAALKAALSTFNLNRFGFEVSPESILSRGFGVVPNSNIQLLFQNVTLRDFTFTYLMSPRSKEEAKDINYILRWFKQGMAAKKRTLQAGTGSLLLGTPNIFKLEYKSGKNAIKGINKFKLCALSNFKVNYTSGNQWVAYEEGQPSALSMTMAFKEIEPIYDTDYQDTNDNIDTPPVKDDEIGF